MSGNQHTRGDSAAHLTASCPNTRSDAQPLPRRTGYFSTWVLSHLLRCNAVPGASLPRTGFLWVRGAGPLAPFFLFAVAAQPLWLDPPARFLFLWRWLPNLFGSIHPRVCAICMLYGARGSSSLGSFAQLAARVGKVIDGEDCGRWWGCGYYICGWDTRLASRAIK